MLNGHHLPFGGACRGASLEQEGLSRILDPQRREEAIQVIGDMPGYQYDSHRIARADSDSAVGTAF
jgi:hypothetical protein